MLKKISLMHEKGQIHKIKESICNILVEATNICNNLSKVAVLQLLSVGKLKLNLKCKWYVYSEPSHPFIMNQALTYMKYHYKFSRYISHVKRYSSFSMLLALKDKILSVTDKNISD